MMVFFAWPLGRKARYVAAVSGTLFRRAFWLVLFFLGWASMAQAAIPASERQVLLDLYASTNGANWTSNSGWNGPAGTECTWYGVECDATQSHVAGIDLHGKRLVGTLPSLEGLTELRYFLVDNNQLTGSIPSLSGRTALQSIDVSYNQLTGFIPSLSGLTGLQNFSARDNQLTGSIPSLSGLTALTIFLVHSNQLTGPIPSLSGLTALQYFHVGVNQLSGSIPSLNGLTALKYFEVNQNQLTGPIPSLSGLTALQIFWVSHNQLSGPVPAPPTSLLVGQTHLCSNSLISSGDPAIDAAWVAVQATSDVAGGNWLACQRSVAPSNLLTVTKTGTGSGTVTSSAAGINCGAMCSGSFTSGTRVTLTATPSAGSTFSGWSGACTGTGTCAVAMDAAKSVSATFNPVPFSAVASLVYAPQLSPPPPISLTTRISFNTSDVGKTGAVFVTAWVPISTLGGFGISITANGQMRVTSTLDNPNLTGVGNSLRLTQETLAATDSNAFVLIQKTSSGWELVRDGQLIPYASGVLGDQLAAQTILNGGPGHLEGTQFCLGYGTSAAEMIVAGRLQLIAAIPDPDLASAATGSCLLTTLPVYRFFNNNAGGHFFTISEEEKNTVIANYPWFRFEGVGFYAYPTPVPGTSPVYRFFNNTAGGHFFTISESEKDTVIGNYNWFRYEGAGFYAYPLQIVGTFPVYRFFNNNAGGHFFTLSESEKTTVTNNYNWFRYEGSGFYAYPPQ